MLKPIVLFLATILIVVNCSDRLGGYSDRPKLIEDTIVQSLTRYASEHIAATQNLVLDHIKITRVQTQVVAGINYKIDFNAQSSKGKLMSCQTLIYVKPDLTTTITEGQCHPA
jgi:hypothetical protein